MKIKFRNGESTYGHLNTVNETSITFYEYGTKKDRTLELKDIKKISK